MRERGERHVFTRTAARDEKEPCQHDRCLGQCVAESARAPYCTHVPVGDLDVKSENAALVGGRGRPADICKHRRTEIMCEDQHGDFLASMLEN